MHAHSFCPLPFRLHRARANGAVTDRAADLRDDGPVIRLLVASSRLTPPVILAPWLPILAHATALHDDSPAPSDVKGRT
jgi:hypothetical protein